MKEKKKYNNKHKIIFIFLLTTMIYFILKFCLTKTNKFPEHGSPEWFNLPPEIRGPIGPPGTQEPTNYLNGMSESYEEILNEYQPLFHHPYQSVVYGYISEYPKEYIKIPYTMFYLARKCFNDPLLNNVTYFKNNTIFECQRIKWYYVENNKFNYM